LRRLDAGVYAIPSALPAGIYVVKAGAAAFKRSLF
jgi:hypothetical protein